MGKRDEQEYYSLMNVTNGNILSARLNPIPWGVRRKEVHIRPRNFKISQFQTGSDILSYFVNSEPIEDRWSMGVHEIWVKPEDIDELYTVLGSSCLNNFCPSWKKQSALFGAFLFHKDPELFLALDFTATTTSAERILKSNALGKDFIYFLEEFNILSFIKSHYGDDAKQRNFFSTAEIDLVKRTRKDIVTKFEHVDEEARKKREAIELARSIPAPDTTAWANTVAQTASNLLHMLQALKDSNV